MSFNIFHPRQLRIEIDKEGKLRVEINDRTAVYRAENAGATIEIEDSGAIRIGIGGMGTVKAKKI